MNSSAFVTPKGFPKVQSTKLLPKLTPKLRQDCVSLAPPTV